MHLFDYNVAKSNIEINYCPHLKIDILFSCYNSNIQICVFLEDFAI